MTSLHSTHSHKAAHLGSRLDIPYLHKAVHRPADDALVIGGESDGPHAARVPCQRAELPPTHISVDPLTMHLPSGESDGPDTVRVTRQRVHLTPTRVSKHFQAKT